MKICQISDIHAGFKYGGYVLDNGLNVRENDGYITLQKIVTDIIEEGVDLVIVAGDIFHTPKPEIRTIVFVQNQLRRFHEAGIKVLMLAGNHEATDIIGDIASSKVLDDPLRNIFSHAEPYAIHRVSDDIYVHLVSHHSFIGQKDSLKEVHPVKGALNIFSTHGSVIDPILKMKLHTEQSPREIVIPNNLLMRGWDYLMLGHIHDRGWVGADVKEAPKVYYNGSTLRRGFADVESELGKGWTLWEINSDGTFNFTFKNVEQRPQYDFPVIDAYNLSPSEITELVIDRLQKTRLTEGLDLRQAPIIRQVVKNLPTSKDSLIDRASILKMSDHCLTWNLDVSKVDDFNTKKEVSDDTTKKIGTNAISTSMVETYDKWVEDSEILNGVDNKEAISENARRFIKLGEEEVLDAR